MTLILSVQVLYAAYLLWVWRGFRRIRMRSSHPQDRVYSAPFVSVVVPYRNESQVLNELIGSLSKQDYPAELVEWILVDDHSEDNGTTLLKEVNDPRLKILSLPPDRQGKKSAIRYAVEAARGEWILSTDADCIHPIGWISSMIQAGEADDAKMVCGRVRVMQDGSLLTLMQDMETCFLQTAGAGSLANGVPLLNTGASLLFRRGVYLDSGGHVDNMHIASGDDTFLMLAFNRRCPGKVIPISSAAATALTRPQPSWKAWIVQRSRWQAKVVHYPAGRIHLAGLVVLASSIAICTLWVMTWSSGLDMKWLWLALSIRIIPEFLVLQSGQRGNPPINLAWVLLASMAAPFFQLISGFIAFFIPQRWKGRDI